MALAPILFAAWLPTAAVAAAGWTGNSTAAKAEAYGGDLLTPQERAEHRQRLRAAKSPEERQQLRAAYETRLRERAPQRGIALPGGPPASAGGVAPDERVRDTPQPGADGLGEPRSLSAPSDGPPQAEETRPSMSGEARGGEKGDRAAESAPTR